MPLAFSDTYIFRSFFKTLFLVISLGFIHGMVILPVFMSLIGPKGIAKMGEDQSHGVEMKNDRQLAKEKANGKLLGETGNNELQLVNAA